ncbi:hypothetical protein Zm00014a_009299 [Zea mays]|uniref:Uncharacterized protein n=1 Tax=Zea mays TaxID=4577 RepID=A0A3L6ET70_MAIZE|nr:hypothetical protein Zm00014a_009299 [Zea mays]
MATPSVVQAPLCFVSPQGDSMSRSRWPLHYRFRFKGRLAADKAHEGAQGEPRRFCHEARDADRWDSEADDLAPHHSQHARVRTELEDQLLYTYRCHFLDGGFSDFKALPRASGELSDF